MPIFGPQLPFTIVDVKPDKTDNKSRESYVVSSQYGSSSCVPSAFLEESVNRENLKDLEWYFERYSSVDSFDEARAQATESSLNHHGKSLIAEFLPHDVLPGLARRGDIHLRVHETQSRSANFFWESVEDGALWHASKSSRPRNVTVTRVLDSPRRQVVDGVTDKVALEAREPSSFLDERRRIFVVTARLSSTQDIPHRLISRAIHKAVQAHDMELHIVRPGSFAALESALNDSSRPMGRSDILHLDLHGLLDENDKYDSNGVLVPDLVDSKDVVQLISRHGIQTVVLNACRSAAGQGQASNLASLLVNSDVQVSVGMRYNVLSQSAQIFMEHFYRQLLVHRRSASDAASIARSAVRQTSLRPSRYGHSVSLYDCVVPVVYCLDNVDQPTQETTEATSSLPEEVLEDKTLFSGREGDMLELESVVAQLGQSCIVNVCGQPGVGKTRFLEEVDKWWTSTGLIARTIKVRLDNRLASSLMGWDLDRFQKELGHADVFPKTLVIIDDIDLLTELQASSQRGIRSSLKRAKGSIILLGSRRPIKWLQSIAVEMTLQPLDFAASMALADDYLALRGGDKIFPKSRQDRSYLEQYFNIARGNPLAIQVIIWHLAYYLYDGKGRVNMQDAFDAFLNNESINISPDFFEDENQSRAVFELAKLFLHFPVERGSDADKDLRSNFWQFGKLTSADVEADERLQHHDDQLLRLSLGAFCHYIPVDIQPLTDALTNIKIFRMIKGPIDKSITRTITGIPIHSRQAAKQKITLAQYTANRMPESSFTPTYLQMADENKKELIAFVENDLREYRSEAKVITYGAGHDFAWDYNHYELDPLATLVARSSSVRGGAPCYFRDDLVISMAVHTHFHIAVWETLEDLRPWQPGGIAISNDAQNNFMNYLCFFASLRQTGSWQFPDDWALISLAQSCIGEDTRRVVVVAHLMAQFAEWAAGQVEKLKLELFPTDSPHLIKESLAQYSGKWIDAASLELFGMRTAAQALPLSIEGALPTDAFDRIFGIFGDRPMLPHVDGINKHYENFVAQLNQSKLSLRITRPDSGPIDMAELVDAYKALLTTSNSHYKDNLLATTINDNDSLAQQFLQMQSPQSNLVASWGSNKRSAEIVAGILLSQESDIQGTLTKLEDLLEEEIEGANEPRTRVMLHRNLADFNTALGNYDLATMHSKREHALLQTLDPRSREIHSQMATRLSKLFSESLAATRAAPTYPQKLADTLNDLFGDESWRDVQSDSQALQERIIDRMLEKLPSETDPEKRTDQMNQIGSSLQSVDRYEESIPIFQEVLAARMATLPKDHDMVLVPAFSLAKAYNTPERRGAGIQLFSAVLEALETRDNTDVKLLTLGKSFADHLLTRTKGSLGVYLMSFAEEQQHELNQTQRDIILAKAEEYMRAALDYYIQGRRPTKQAYFDAPEITQLFSELKIDPQVELHRKEYATSSLNLAYLCEVREKYEESETLYLDCISVVRGYSRDLGNPQLLMAQSHLAHMYEKIGRVEEAEQLFSEVLQTHVEVKGANHPETIKAITNLGMFYVGQGEQTKARQLSSRYQAELAEAGRSFEGGFD